jgi:hypothetical protein
VEAVGKPEEIKFEERLVRFSSKSSVFSPASANVRIKISFSLSMALQSFCWTLPEFQFLNPTHSL